MEAINNPNGFQIKPDLENILRSDKIKEIISKILSETLLGKKNLIFLLFLDVN
jgi:hypothetical protein